MKIRIRYVKALCGLSAAAFVLALAASRARAQAGVQSFVPGQLVVYCQPGTPQAGVQSLANVVSAVKIIPNLMKDVYEFVLPQGQATIAGTTAAVAALKGNVLVKWVGPNQLGKLATTSVTPNDALYGEMWPLPLVNMPQAWVLQKGNTSVEVADIDSGFDPAHADLLNRYDLVNSYNWGDNNTQITATLEDHGVSTSGIMIANTNNGIGVASMCWQSVLCVGEKLESDAAAAGVFTLAEVLSCYADVQAKYKKAHIVTVNMSYIFPGNDPTDTTNPQYVALLQLSQEGVILVAAAGNDSGDNRALGNIPGLYPFVISVSAINRNSQLTYYSDFGKIDIAAPGGEQFSDTDPNGYLVCKLGSGYAFEQGTSFASPAVCGIATLLMCVPGVTATKAQQVLLSTANKTGLSALPDLRFGNGIVDAYAALVQVSSSTGVLAPDGIDPSTGTAIDGSNNAPPPVTTQKPLMSFNAYNIPTDSETITIDPGATSAVSFTATQLIQSTSATPLANISDVTVSGTTTGTNPQYSVSFRYAFPATSSGSHTIQVVGINPSSGQTITDSSIFVLSPHIFTTDANGIAFVSIPYYSDPEDLASAKAAGAPSLLPSTVNNLYRWLDQGTYNVWGANHTSADIGASSVSAALDPTLTPTLDPKLFIPTQDPSSAGALNPIGNAFFMQTSGVNSPAQFTTYGLSYPSTAFSIPLHQGWNMVGDPYTFSVDFNGMEIQELSGARITVQTAADQNFLLPHIYQYANGDYTFQSLPNGTLDPWQGQWIYVLPTPGSSVLSTGVAGYLIVTPAAIAGSGRAAKALTPQVQRAMTSQPAVTGAGSWSVQLQAASGTLHDNTNFVGESSRATLGMDSTKVPKPPKIGNYVSVGLSHSGLGITGLAQDLLPIGGSRTWQVAVTSSQGKAPVTLAWPNINTVPKNYRLVLTDSVSGQNVDMRNQSSYEFTSGAANSTRSFTLTATPSNGRTHVVISNISVNPGRTGGRAAGTTQINYNVSADSNVDVSVMGTNGRVIALVSPSRAVTGGLNSVVWTGQDVKGHTVPGGTYILQIRAIDAGGDLTRQIVPFTVTGR